MPAPLLAAETLIDAARVAPLTLINVVDNRAARQVGTAASAMAVAYPKVWTLGNKRTNTIVAGCANARRPNLAHVAAGAAADRSPAQLTERHGFPG